MNFDQSLFWDVDPSTLDPEQHEQFIIQRVVQRGSLHDWRELKAHYGLERIRKASTSARSLDSLTLNFLSKLFALPKSAFKCYTNRFSQEPQWPF